MDQKWSSRRGGRSGNTFQIDKNGGSLKRETIRKVTRKVMWEKSAAIKNFLLSTLEREN